ncbi:hypothetical protein B0H10DRAFT_2210189 [Mycena sp. CBHHK59/15]|nr:hypothetical protein B0H10DRAFT_2210189 [Mycena sp. CBHHK59/15]
MAIPDSTKPVLPDRVALFRHPCARGCSYKFEHEGANSVQRIAALVRAHEAECQADTRNKGGNYAHLLPKIVRELRRAEDDGAQYEPESGRGGALKTAGALRTRNTGDKRALREGNERTWGVYAHTVVCRSCRTTVKLDSRARYAPRSWKKHHEQCRGLDKMRSIALNELGTLGEGAEAKLKPQALYEPTRLLKRTVRGPSAGGVEGAVERLPRRKNYRKRK